MRRRYVKGKQFWAIECGRTNVTVTEGKLGTPGTAKTIKFKTPEAAQAGYRAQLAALPKGFTPALPVEATEPALEAALRANPDDTASFAVYADWLQSHDQPRGALAALDAAIAKLARGKPADETWDVCDSDARETWYLPSKAKSAKALLAKHAALLADHALDPVPFEVTEQTGKGWTRAGIRLVWQHGFVRAAWVGLGGMELDERALASLLRHPSCRFLRSLTINEVHDNGLGDRVIAGLAKAVPATVRHLHIGDFGIGSPPVSWYRIGKLAPLYAALPQLETLILQGSAIDFGKAIVLPALRRLEVRTGQLERAAAKAIAASAFPALEHLLIWFGDRDYGATAKPADIAPLLAAKLPLLAHLALANCEQQEELVALVLASKLLPQLRSLDLSRGSLDDAGAQLLADARAKLAHLTVLDVSDSYLTKRGVKLVKGLAKRVLAGEQREPYDWDDTKRRYVSVGE